MVAAGAAAGVFAAPNVVLGRAKMFAGKSINVHFWSGPEGETIIKNVVDPFKAETGAEIVIDYGVTSDSIAKLRAQKNDPQLDVTMMDDIGVFATGAEGLLTKLDPSRIPNMAQIDPRFLIDGGLGVGFFTYSDTMVYNTNHFKSPPTSYEAMWDPKLKDRVGVPGSDQSDALKLMVVAAKLEGGDEYHIEKGFKKLAALKPNVNSFVHDWSVTGELMKKGDIVVTYLIPYLWKEQMAKGYPIRATMKVKEGVVTTVSCCAIPKGHPGPQDVAEAFVNKALSVPAETGMARGLWYGPTNKNVKIADESISANLIMPEDFNRIIYVNPAYLAKVRGNWIQRYDELLKR
jgi:putative spermidine/putrescine transport system substrate-binding protein